MFTNNISFTPIRQSEATETIESPDEIFNRGLYCYANQDREKNLIDKDEDILDRERPYKDKAADIFGSNYIPFNDVTNRNYFLGNALIARKGFANNPYGYAMQHEPDLVKTGKSAEEILSAVGGKEIERQRKIYDDRIAQQQAIEASQREAEKALNETYQQLPTEIAKIIRAGSNLTKLRDSKLKSEEFLAKIPENIASTKTGTIKKAWEDTATRVKGKLAQNEQEIAKLEEYLKDDVSLPPEMLDKLTKYQASDNAIASVQRAKTAWQYAFPLMGNNGFVKRQSYQSLVQIAKALTDESGNLDKVALASFAIAMHEEAKERQAEHPDPYARFWGALKNAFSDADDARIHTDLPTHVYHDMIKEGASAEEATAFVDALKGKNVETLRSIWLEAVDMSMEPSERANWHASMLSSLAGVMGQQVIPLVGAVAGAAATRGASGTMQLGRIGKNAINYFGGWAGGAAATYPGLYSRAYSNAVRDGKINPEAYAANEAIAQAASEGAFSAVTTLRPISKGVGTALNYGLSRAGGSKIASNAAAISITSWLGGSMLEGSLELLEEELSGMGGTTLNALSRACGVEVSPQTYKLGEALGQMKSYEIAAFYTYAALFGGAQLPNNYRNARKFASNTERLLDAGHTPEAAREVQYHVLQAEEQIAEIQSDDKLTPHQKLQQQTKVEETCFAKQKEILIGDITNANPEKVRKRLEARGEKHLTQGELTSAINGKVAENIFKQHGIIEAMPEAGNKYRVVFETEEETKEDGTKTAPKLVVKEWNRNQLVNFLQIKQTDLLQKHTRAFQSLVKAKASAQNVTIDGLKVEFQNMRDTPLEAYAALEKHNAITEEFIFEAANIARNLITERQAGGMTFEEALSSPSGLFHGISLGEVAELDSAAQQRKRQEAATTSGQMQGISESSKVEYGGINFYRPDGSVLVAYASSRANTNDIMEELLEGLLKHHIATGKVTMQQLETFLRDMDDKLPGVSILPTNKAKNEYTQSDFIEAYSKLALSNYLYDEAYLPLNEEEHQLLREIGQTVDAARILKTIGDAYHTFINSDEGKKYLADGGKTLDEILRDAGFAVGEVVAKAKTTAEQEIKIAEERDWIPSVERQIEELMTEAQAEEQLAETNEQEAKEPTIIPAEESITGEEIVVEPQEEPIEEANVQSAHVEKKPAKTKRKKKAENSLTRLSNASEKIHRGKGTTRDYAIYLRSNVLTEAEAIEKGIAKKSQNGLIHPFYSMGQRIAESLTDEEFEIYCNGGYSVKELEDILSTRTKEYYIKEANELTPKTLPKSPKWPKMPQKGVTEQDAYKAVVKSLLSSISTDKTRYVLNFVYHSIADGVETFAATDGRRLSVVSRTAPIGSKDVIETLDKEGNPIDAGVYPDWRKVMIPSVGNSGTLDLSPYRYAESLTEKKRKVEVGRKVTGGKIYETETYIPQEKWQVEGESHFFLWQHNDKLYKFNPIIIRDAINLFSSASKVSNMPSIVSVDVGSDGQMLWRAEHNGWEVKHIAMPMRIANRLGVESLVQAKKGDILLNPTPAGGTANFSVKPAQENPSSIFVKDQVGVRMLNHVRMEAKRFARVFGDKQPYEQAVNAVQSALAIIGAVDKYMHAPDKPVAQKYRNRLTKLRSIVEKYAQIINTGKERSFKKISAAEQKELDAAIAELEQAEIESAITESDKLIESEDKLNKKTREARAKEHKRNIVRHAAKGRVYASLAEMLNVAGDVLDDYLKARTIKQMKRITDAVKIKRTPGKRLKGKMTAPAYRELERAIELMALSQRAYEEQQSNVSFAQDVLAKAIKENDSNITQGNVLLTELAKELEQQGVKVTPRTLTDALVNYASSLTVYGCLDNKNFEQTRLAALSLYNLISRGRNTWQQIQLDKKEAIENYYQYFLANTSAVSGRSSKIQEIIDKAKNSFDFLPDSMMNTAQLFMALASYKPLQPLFEHLRYSLATAQIAREKHLREMRDADLAAFGRILGVEPATEAGYSKKQLKAISKKFDAFFEENNQHHDTGIVIKFESQSADESNAVQTEEYNLACTNWEALYYILAYRQPHYQINAQLHGFTDNVLKQLQEHIGDKLMSFGEHIQKAIINDGTVPVYEEREGIPMRENPLYFPISAEINTINTTREEPLVNPYHPAGGFDFIKARVRHHKQIAQKNAYVVYRNSLAERSNYVHLDPIVAPLRSLMARDEFVNRLTSLIGPGLTSQLRQAMKEIIGAGYQETSLQDFSNDKVASALSASTLAVLSGNPSSIIRQASAIANAGLMPGINPQDVLKYMIFMMKKQNRENGAVVGHVSISDVLKFDAFQTRYRDNSYVAEMLSMGNNVKYSTILDITKKAMNAMDTADIWANAVSATIVYNHKYDQLKDLNIYSEAQLKKLCEQEVNTYTRLLAQPLHRMDKSAFYWKLSANVFGRAMLYMGSESINKIGMLRSNYIVRRNKGQGRIRASLGVFLSMGLTVGLANFVWESFIAWITGNLPDEDDDSLAAWLIATYTNSAFAQYAEISPFFGQFTRTLFSVFGLYGDNSMKIPGVDTFKRGSKLYTMLTDDKDYSPAEWQRETTRFLREFTAICGFLGGAYSQYRWVSSTAATMHLLTTGNNALYPFSTGIQKGSSFYSDWLNIPDSVLETMSKTDSRKGKRSKSLLEQWLTPKPEQRTIEEIMAEIEKMDLTSQPDALK